MDFSSLAAAFAKAGTGDSRRIRRPGQEAGRLQEKIQAQVPLGSDETLKMLEAYGVWAEKSMYGRKFMGVVRTTLLIGPTGRIARIWPKVKVQGHAQEVLEAAKEL